MYLFSRRRQASGAHLREAMAFAVEVAGRASSVTGLQVTPWMSVLSADSGTFVWTVTFEHMADYETAMGKLMGDAGYMDAVEQADRLFLGTTEDGLAQLIHGAPDPARRPTVAATVRAVCANGHMAAGLAGAVELAELYTKVTGVPMMVGTTATGSYGGVGWLIGHQSMADMQAAEAAINSSEEFVAAVDRIGPNYLPGATTSMVRRLN